MTVSPPAEGEDDDGWVNCVLCGHKDTPAPGDEVPPDSDYFCAACSEFDRGVFVPRTEAQDQADDDGDGEAPPRRPTPPPVLKSPTPFTRPPLPAARTAPSAVNLPLAAGGSTLGAILSGLANSTTSANAAAPQRLSLYAGHVLRHEIGQSLDAVVWRGFLTLGESADAPPEVQCALQQLPHLKLPLLARGPAAGAVGGGVDGASRASAVGRVLPADETLTADWVAANDSDVPVAGECLATLRLSCGSDVEGDVERMRSLVSVLEQHGGGLRCEAVELVLWLFTSHNLPPDFRPRSTAMTAAGDATGAAVLHALVVEQPLPPLAGLPAPGAQPGRGILASRAIPPPHDEGDTSPPDAHAGITAVAPPPQGTALSNLRFVLLGFSDTDPAVQAALAEGAVLVQPGDATPQNVDVIVLDPARMMQLNDGPLRLADFLAARRVTIVLGTDYLSVCAHAHARLPPWPPPSPGHEMFPSGIAIVTDAVTLASSADMLRSTLALLSRCSAASNAAAAAAGVFHRGCLWRLMMSPGEHAALMQAAHTRATPHAHDALLAFQEAVKMPGPGVGIGGGVPRAAVMVPSEVSRSTVPFPPQTVRDAAKLAAMHAHDCRLVLLMTIVPELQAALKMQSTIAGGSPQECFALLSTVLEQARSQTSRSHAAATADVSGDAVVAPQQGQKVVFAPEVDALPKITCSKLHSVRKREREFVPEEPAAKSSKREEEGGVEEMNGSPSTRDVEQ
jgi:hypothetical protein